MSQDLRYALRQLRKSPGFAAAAVTTLVLGIGATTAVFSVVNAVLLRPLPYRQSDRLVHVLGDDPQDSRAGVSYGSFEIWRGRNRSFEDLAIYYRNSGWSRVTLNAPLEPQVVQAGYVSAGFFPVLGMSPALGRVFGPREESRREAVAVLSYSLWERGFGGDASVLGKTIEVDGRPFTVVGVMPRSFRFPARGTMLWLPLTTNRYWLDRPAVDNVHARGYFLRWNVVGRLRGQAVARAAAAELAAMAGGADSNLGLGIKVLPLTIELAGNARLAMIVLLVASSLVLLMACANVANLLLARGMQRAREWTIRTALGASPGRLVRQVLTESLTLAGASAGLAVCFAAVAVRLLVCYGPADLPRLEETHVDGGVLGFTLAVSALAAMLFGLLPALRPGGSVRGRGLLVVSEFALAVLLVAGAGLFVRSLRAVDTVDLGFRPHELLTMRVRLSGAARQEDLLARLRGIPGVRYAGGINALFELDQPPLNSLRAIEGRPADLDRSRPLTWNTVSGDYFRAMDIPLLAGRTFSESDTAGAPLVAVIDDAMARRYWPLEDPLGKRFKGQDARGRGDEWLTVIGVVKNARRQGLEQQPTPHVYEWSRQAETTSDWVIRTAGDPLKLAPAVRGLVREVEPRAVVSSLTAVDRLIDRQTSVRRFRTWLLGLFAAMALVLSTVGIYGVISYSTTRRTREIGIRMALGAPRAAILGMILRQGLVLGTAGLAMGMVAALSSARLLGALLFGITPTDPLTFGIVGAALPAVAGAATLIPALRATRVSPAVALRHD